MNLPPDDPLAGFFTLSKPLPRIELRTGRGPVAAPSRDERLGDDPAAVHCPVVGDDDSDEEPFSAAANKNEYWREIRYGLASLKTDWFRTKKT